MQELRNFALPQSPWIIGGDFNLIRWLSDRPNSSPDWHLMDTFNDTIRHLNLFDVPLQGRNFTWSNKQPNPTFSKIDRILLSPSFLLALPLARLQAGPMLTSDHVPLLLTCTQPGRAITTNRIERFWLRYTDFAQITAQIFCSTQDATTPDPVLLFSNSIKDLHSRLRTWHLCKFANLDTYLQNSKTVVSFFDKIEETRPLTLLEFLIRVTTKQVAYDLAANLEIKWHQRSRSKWLKAGDRNTSYFHALASSKKARKAIHKISVHGSDITHTDHIISAFFDHYKQLMGTTCTPQMLDISVLYPHPHNLCNLDSPFTTLEVQRAVSQLASNKSSGPDGLPNEFIKQQWQVLQTQVMNLFHCFFSQQLNLQPINEARIILVPKTDSPISVKDYRPISVINLLPKLFSKVLANRIKDLMPQLIDHHQTAFVQGRFIAENFLATREVLHHVHSSGSPALLLKLDYAKAFDTLDWNFLLRVMAFRGFPTKFIGYVSHLLSSASSRILVNGSLSPPFSHNRGLRQGDPLSPYLFILAADVLQRMTTLMSAIIPHSLSHRIHCPVITFQYADDTVFIVSARGKAITALLLIIHCFSQTSGLTVNLSKSSFVPLSIPHQYLQSIGQLLGCKQQNFPISYLGMPLSIKKPTRQDFLPLLKKLEHRLDGWKARLISRAGKLQLVKSVLSSIPTYYMSCFVFPKWLVARIDSIRRDFLWSRPHSSHPIHLLNWQAVCLPIVNGGLGVLNLLLQNTSLLLRWWWRLYASDRSLWYTYASCIYAASSTTNGPLIFSSVGSFFWKSIAKIRPIFNSAVCFRLASGRETSFWYDAWAGQPLATQVSTPITRRMISVSDASHIFHQLIPGPLTKSQFEAYIQITSATTATGTDTILWNLSSSGVFSASSIDKVLSQGGKIRAPFFSIWKSRVTPSMRLFFFFLLQNRLMTHDNMLKRHLHHSPGCVMCSLCPAETALHLFFKCPYAIRIWDAISTALGYSMLTAADTPQLVFLSSAPSDKNARNIWLVHLITATSLIWRERNNRTFRNSSTSHQILLERIMQEASLCLKYC